MGNSLTRREWGVLLELLGKQGESDKTAAAALGMAPSNFAVIKKRLADRGMLQEEVRVNMHRVPEAKIAAFVWIDYNQLVKADLRKAFEDARPTFPTAVSYAAPDWSLDIDYFSSFEDAENARLRLAQLLRGKANKYVSDSLWKMVPLSHLATCHMMKRFVEHCMGRKPEYVDISGSDGQRACELPSAAPPARLTDTEKRTLVAFRTFPSANKSAIAKKIGVQQSSLSEIVKSLRAKGVISYVRTVDPSTLPGIEVATFALADLRQPLLGDELGRSVSDLVNKLPQLLRVSYTPTFFLAVGYFDSLDSAENAHLTMLKAFGDNLKFFTFKVVPCSHLRAELTPYSLEHMFAAKT